MSFKVYFNSITTRLVFLFLTTGILIVFVFKLTTSISLNSLIETDIRPNFIHYAKYIVDEIDYPPSIEKAKKISHNLNIDISINGQGMHWHSTKEPIVFSSINFFQPKVDINNTSFHSALYDDNFSVLARIGQYEVFLIMGKHIPFKHNWGTVMGISIIMALLTLLFLFIYSLFRALRTLQVDVKRIGTGDLNHRIHLKRSDDLGDLAIAVNGMADEIQNMLEAKRQMLLAISHELRSPLTRSKLALAVMNDSPQRDSISYDIDEMEAMINELLEAERLNDKHKALNLETHNLNNIINEIINEQFTDQYFTLSLDETLSIQNIDGSRIRFIIKNIIENAIKYQGNNTRPILIKTQQYKQKTILEITDYGIGIVPEHISRLTEPFYRVDPSRQRKTGGFGLGLYLCKLISEAHKGSLIIKSKLNQSTTISITLPQDL